MHLWYTLWVKKGTSILLPITLADVHGFSKFFHCWIHQEICNKLTVTLPTTPSTCCYTTLWNGSCHKQPFSYQNNAFNINSDKQKVIYCQFMIKFKCKLQRLFEISPFRTDTGTKSRTPLIDRVVDDALLQTVPHVNQTLLQIVYRIHQFRGSYAAVFWVLLFSSFSREIQQVISYSYNL